MRFRPHAPSKAGPPQRRGASFGRLRAAIATALLVACAGPAAAGNLKRATFAKQVAKYAAADFSAPKAICVCQQPGHLIDVTGLVVPLDDEVVITPGEPVSRVVKAVCAVMGFDPATGLNGDVDACDTFVVLSR